MRLCIYEHISGFQTGNGLTNPGPGQRLVVAAIPPEQFAHTPDIHTILNGTEIKGTVPFQMGQLGFSPED